PPVSSRGLFFIDPDPTDIYTLSLHDALPIFRDTDIDRRAVDVVVRRDLRRAWRHTRRRVGAGRVLSDMDERRVRLRTSKRPRRRDRKSTRLNSSHVELTYAVICLTKNDRSGA